MSKNVLIIDDNIEIQTLLKMYLESKGYHIDCSYNGKEALELLSTTKHLPDMILLDLTMPVMDGVGFLNVRNQNSKFQNIPVVLMSGEENIEFVTALDSVADVLKKPLSISSVVGAVERNLH